MTRVLIVDDEEIISSSLKIMLSTCDRFEVVGIASNGEEACEMARQYRPDVILMDVFMPIMNGVECTRRIKSSFPSIKIIILTTFNDDQYVFGALSYGASGYLLKGISLRELEKAIDIVMNGGAMINPDITQKVISRFTSMMLSDFRLKADERELKKLTATERMLIKNVGKGLSNREISAVLMLGEGTVRNYISAILDKLGFRDRTQLAIFAVQSGLFMGEEVEA